MAAARGERSLQLLRLRSARDQYAHQSDLGTDARLRAGPPEHRHGVGPAHRKSRPGRASAARGSGADSIRAAARLRAQGARERGRPARPGRPVRAQEPGRASLAGLPGANELRRFAVTGRFRGLPLAPRYRAQSKGRQFLRGKAMAKETKIGSNRTGIQMSPKDSKEIIEAAANAMPTSEGDHMSLALLRSDYIADAEPLGTVPPPGTLKGVLKSGMDMMTGDRPQVLLDKLGERAAFERGGTRLYDAVLSKFDADPHAHGSVSRDVLQQFRNEEARHFQLVCEAVEQLGGDPTAMTPCANLVGMQAMGLWHS